VITFICKKALEIFWTGVLRLSYYIGMLDRPSPGKTNIKLALDMNYCALHHLWKLEDFKIGWLFKLFGKNSRARLYLLREPKYWW